MDPTVPPRPCVNGTMAGSANGEEQEESGTGETMEGEAISESMEEQYRRTNARRGREQ